MDREVLKKLEQRLGPLYAKQRLGIERDHEAQVFGQGLVFFHPENWRESHALIQRVLKVLGLYWRGRRNAARVEVKYNPIAFENLPPNFDGFTILHITDIHVEISHAAIRRIIEHLPSLHYDICVLTGDYRNRTHGPYHATLEGLKALRTHLKHPVYGVLGNHDTIHMVPGMEEMGIQLLLNECETIVRGDQRIHLAGVDDAHYYRMDNIDKASAQIPAGEFSILLSHTPEIYRNAAHAGFDLMLSGHTHGGQICLPGSIPIILDSDLPRHMGAGAWRHHDMVGYTSRGAGACIVPVRINCPPEITLHQLKRA